ncbi:hypothetical protein NO1_0055 [Candidatus Termititenax aidoneus]|uniref:Uncharacterized protein n=1 Tax=Termititenax aidoneus TaxID=2218524 RepID=A0A388TA37_TERA1|nr:hypothetical protein NO1_0055 [Candidatus Termititenax aidoneus]
MLRLRAFLLLGLAALLLTGCQPDTAPEISLPALTLPQPQKISELDKNYKQLAKAKTLVQIRGKIIYQSRTTGGWAFVEDDTGTALLDFEPTSPNFTLPPKQLGKTLTAEGRVSLDESVINEYLLVPATYKFE